VFFGSFPKSNTFSTETKMMEISKTLDHGEKRGAPLLPHRAVALNRAATLAGIFIAGFATFMNLYATQPLLPYFRRLFGTTELLVSLTVSAPVLAVALAAPLLGVAADSVGRKQVIVAAIGCLSFATLLSASASSLWGLIVYRFLQGLFIPGMIAVVMAYISEESPIDSVGQTMAVYVTGTVAGGFAGRLLAGLGTAHWGWSRCFVCLGVLTFLGALVTHWILPQERVFAGGRKTSLSLQPLWAHLKNPQLLATYAAGFNILFCMVATFTYVNFYLAQKPFGLGPGELGEIFIVYLAGGVMTTFAGPLMDRIGYRKALLRALSVESLGILLTLSHYLPAVLLGLVLVATGVFISQTCASSNVGKAARGARSSAAGLYVCLYYLGGFTGSIIPGFFWARAGWPACVAVILCAQALTALIALRLWKA
jgi:predicted MFS family arabinose efflux permease